MKVRLQSDYESAKSLKVSRKRSVYRVSLPFEIMRLVALFLLQEGVSLNEMVSELATQVIMLLAKNGNWSN